jgi:FtsP/CotA-like multicopper oxidase with cupredoxin domain
MPNRTVQLQAQMSLRSGVNWMVDGKAHHHADPVRVGQLQVWDVVNETKMDHPFHLHGFFFQVVEVNGAPPEFLSWQDTINLPAKGRVRIAWVPNPVALRSCRVWRFAEAMRPLAGAKEGVWLRRSREGGTTR